MLTTLVSPGPYILPGSTGVSAAVSAGLAWENVMTASNPRFTPHALPPRDDCTKANSQMFQAKFWPVWEFSSMEAQKAYQFLVWLFIFLVVLGFKLESLTLVR
jgi:hypothetical protein